MEDKISIVKPGERALLAMKDQNKAVVVFKKPAAPIKKKDKKIILTEDKYIEVRTKKFMKYLEILRNCFFYYNSGNG